MSRQRKRFSEADIVALFETLPVARLGSEYTETDRAQDFIKTFTMNDEGKRVLAQISDLCNPNPAPSDADKPGRLAFKEGQRWVLGEIMRCFLTNRRVPKHETKDEANG